MEALAHRIDEIRKANNLTQSEFADHCGIKRSILSHIMSGRNKPSLAVIQQILEGFPKVSTEWLLSGKGSIFNRQQFSSGNKEANAPKNVFAEGEKKSLADQIAKTTAEDKIQTHPPKFINNSSDKIRKIIFLYEDGSFSEHSPR